MYKQQERECKVLIFPFLLWFISRPQLTSVISFFRRNNWWTASVTEWRDPWKRVTVEDVPRVSHWEGQVGTKWWHDCSWRTPPHQEADYRSVPVPVWGCASLETGRGTRRSRFIYAGPCWWTLSSSVCLKVYLFCLCFWKMLSWDEGC